MRIAYLTCVFPPYPGGIGVAAQGMAQEMSRRGHEVEVLTPRPRKDTRMIRERSRDFAYTVRGLVPLLHFGNAAFTPQILWRLRDFDVVHLLYPFYGAAELVPFLRRHSRVKIVAHHMMDAVGSGWLGALFRWHARRLAPRIFHAAHQVLVLSEDYARNSDIANFGVQWEIVPNGVDTNLFRPSETLPTTHYPLPTILFAGGLDRAHYFKGVDMLIKACGILKERGVEFVCQIVGEGDMRREYEKQAQELGLTKTEDRRQKTEISPPSPVLCPLEFVGLVPHDQLPAYYQRATVCVVPATERIECFSIVAAEAQACGIPAVVTNFPGVRVTVEDGVTGFVARPSDPVDLANKIAVVLKDPPQSQMMGKRGRERVQRLYSWKVVGEKLEQIYEQLA